jgi:hypothetical protein
VTAALERRLWALAALVSLALVFCVTLVPTPDAETGTFHWCVLCGDAGLADAIANVVLFVPVAVAMRFAGVSARRTVALLCVVSVAIELGQLLVPGRDSAIGDVVANAAGAVAGVALVHGWRRRRRSASRAAAAAALALGVVAGAVWILRPRFPPTVYWGQWTPRLGQFAWYGGRVLEADVGGTALPDGRLADSRAVRGKLAAGEPLHLKALAGARTRRLAPIFSIADDRERGVVLIGADGDDLVLKVSSRAADLGLHEPELRWRRALAGVAPLDTVAVVVGRGAGGYCVALNGRERCGLAYPTGEIWALAQPLPKLWGCARGALGSLFLGVLGVSFGLLAPRRASGGVLAALLVAGAVVLPPLVGMASTPLLQLGGLVFGILTGVLVPERRLPGAAAPMPPP